MVTGQVRVSINFDLKDGWYKKMENSMLVLDHYTCLVQDPDPALVSGLLCSLPDLTGDPGKKLALLNIRIILVRVL